MVMCMLRLLHVMQMGPQGDGIPLIVVSVTSMIWGLVISSPSMDIESMVEEGSVEDVGADLMACSSSA
jgi:hypothetical protein